MPLGVAVPAQDTRTFTRSDKHGISGFAFTEDLQDAFDIPAGWIEVFYTIGNPSNAAAAARLQLFINQGFKAVLVIQHRDEDNIVFDTVKYATAADALAALPEASFPATSSAVLSTQMDADLALIDSSVKHFIVGNEVQDHNKFWHGTLAEYSTFYRTIRPFFQSKVAGAVVTVCGIADGILAQGVDGGGIQGTSDELSSIDPDVYLTTIFAETHDFVSLHIYRDLDDIPAKWTYIKSFTAQPKWIVEYGAPDPRVWGHRGDNEFNECFVDTEFMRGVELLWDQVPAPERIIILKMTDSGPGSDFAEMGLQDLVTNRWGVDVNPKKRLYNIWRDECFRTRP